MTKSSVNFQPVKSALHAVGHVSREMSPTYLLAPEKSLGTICVLDDEGQVAEKLNLKRSLASARALVEKNFSPLWEGVINLPRPDLSSKKFDAVGYKTNCTEVIKSWIKKYEETTGHKVLRADIHLDEGHIENGQVLLNAHAHVICDRTNDKGRVIKLSPQQLRDLQTTTAEITALERGVNSRVSKKQHINAHVYKALAAKNGLETQQKVNTVVKQFNTLLDTKTELSKKVKKITAEKDVEIEQLKQAYKDLREEMKASGIATQKDYQSLKAAHEKALTTLNERIQKMEEYTQKLNAELVASNAAIAAGLLEKAQLIEALVKSGEKSDAIQAAKVASEQPKQPGAPLALVTPQKPLAERLVASWEAMLDWIKSIGAEQEPVGPSTRHDGPVKHMDDLHCVQKTGRRYALHRLADLDNVPALDDPKMTIWYKDGKGVVEGRLGKSGVGR